NGPNGVLAWLADKTKLPVITEHRPGGTFNFVPPKGKDGKPRRYTLAEVIDLLNADLAKQNLILVRKITSITVLATDRPLPDIDIPRLIEAELAERGETELASVIVRFNNLDAETLEPEVKNLLGRFGKVTSLGKANTLFLRDQAGNLRKAID